MNRDLNLVAWARCLFVGLLLTGCSVISPGPTPTPDPSAFYKELAHRYAPVIRHVVASDQDFITTVNFDGDWVGNNNWENQPEGDLSAHVYYSVVETERHWYLLYSLFHPRDYTYDPCEDTSGCHENDVESIVMAVAKDGTSFGRLVVMGTLAHGDMFLYTPEPVSSPDVQGPIELEEGHPVVWVQAYGHGIVGHPRIMLPHFIVYRVGERAEVPESLEDEDVSYQLVSIYDTLWAHRDEVGPGQAFDQPFSYRGYTLPARIDGDNHGADRASAPWGHHGGDLLLDPAKVLIDHVGTDGDFSWEYVFNPYWVDMGFLDP